MMVKPLVFKGEKRSKKRKAPSNENAVIENDNLNNTTTVTTASHEAQNPTNAEIIDDDSWVSAETPSDIVGPVLLVLSSVPPTCVACDQNGKVYASVVENIIDGQPATAEPHDMRQVWIASTVAGTERIGFKGHHGRYVRSMFSLVSRIKNQNITRGFWFSHSRINSKSFHVLSLFPFWRPRHLLFFPLSQFPHPTAT